MKRMFDRSSTTLCLALALSASVVCAADWTQYRGPKADGSTPETILKTWPQEGPKVLWKTALGDSFGSFAVGGGKAYVFMERKGNEVCVAFDAGKGTELWFYDAGKTIFENNGGAGPRSTPTLDGDKVYILGTYLQLACLNAAVGKEVWKHDLAKEFGGTMQLRAGGISQWGFSSSPLLDDKLIFVHGGGKDGSLLAFDKTTGANVWKVQNELATHASPTVATILGQRQVIFLCQSGLVSVAADTGALLWKYTFKFNISTASTPLVSGDIVYCSAGYNVGTDACKITKEGADWKATQLWHKAQPDCNHWTTPVVKDGYVYGIFGFKDFVSANKPGGPLKCIEIATGKEMWSKPGFGSGGGTILVGGDTILAQSDSGALILVEASPTAYKELARATPLGGKCWTMAIVANGRIYCRSQKQGACLDVGVK
jgi:outer membrane protein assembly factor BamB